LFQISSRVKPQSTKEHEGDLLRPPQRPALKALAASSVLRGAAAWIADHIR
jgi:hypothetical protein